MTKSSKSGGEGFTSSRPPQRKASRDTTSTTADTTRRAAGSPDGSSSATPRFDQSSAQRPTAGVPRTPQPVVPNAKRPLGQPGRDKAGPLSSGDDNDAPGALAQAALRQSTAQGAAQQKSSRISQAARAVKATKSGSLDGLSTSDIDQAKLSGMPGMMNNKFAQKALTGAATKASQSLEANEDDGAVKGAAKQVGRDADKVATGAVKGALKGGLHGAATGAAKGLLKTKSFWAVIAVILLIVGFGVSLIGIMFASVLGTDTDSAQESSSRAVAGEESAQHIEDDYDGADTPQRMMQRVSETTGADFYILSSILAEYQHDGEEPASWFGLTDDAKDTLGSSGVDLIDGQWDVEDEARYVGDLVSDVRDGHFDTPTDASLSRGYSLAFVLGGREPIEGQEGIREQVHDTWVEAIEDLPLRDVEDHSESIVNRAKKWVVDEGTTQENICIPGTTSGGSSGVNIPAEYQQAVERAAAESGFSASIIGAQIQAESNWDPRAGSSAGAQGIAQFMPGTWDSFGEGGDVWNPDDAIAAQGRYMKYLREFMEDHAEDEEHLVRLALAGYNAGQGAVASFNYDLDEMFKHGGYKTETGPYVEKITAAANGDYGVDCEISGGGSSAVEGDIAQTSIALAWDHQVKLPTSTAPSHGRAQSRPEFVETALSINPDVHTAYFTDCGVFVATVMRSSGADPNFPIRGTGQMVSYLSSSPKYDYFIPQSEGELQAGDILIIPGHIYLYTGERNSSPTGRAQGASLTQRPPSGHHLYLSDNRGTYHVARLK